MTDISNHESAAGACPPLSPLASGESGYSIFLSLEGVAGECAVGDYSGWIQVEEYTQTLCASQAPRFTIAKRLDRCSPSIYGAVHSGRVFGSVVLEVCWGVKRGGRFLRIEMSDAVILEINQSASTSSGHSRPVETLVLENRRVQWIYTKPGEGQTSSIVEIRSTSCPPA
jgi:type VI protein secretion system component Hcp